MRPRASAQCPRRTAAVPFASQAKLSPVSSENQISITENPAAFLIRFATARPRPSSEGHCAQICVTAVSSNAPQAVEYLACCAPRSSSSQSTPRCSAGTSRGIHQSTVRRWSPRYALQCTLPCPAGCRARPLRALSAHNDGTSCRVRTLDIIADLLVQARSTSTSPSTERSCSSVMPPGRSRRGRSSASVMTVLSTPTPHAPPSSTAAILPSMSCITCAAVVVDGLPEVFAVRCCQRHARSRE